MLRERGTEKERDGERHHSVRERDRASGREREGERDFRFWDDLISRKLVIVQQNFSLRGKSLVPGEYLSLLSVQGQFGVIRYISTFDDLVSILT